MDFDSYNGDTFAKERQNGEPGKWTTFWEVFNINWKSEREWGAMRMLDLHT